MWLGWLKLSWQPCWWNWGGQDGWQMDRDVGLRPGRLDAEKEEGRGAGLLPELLREQGAFAML